MRYWKKHPPVHMLVAAYLGYENKEVSPETLSEDAQFESLIKALDG